MLDHGRAWPMAFDQRVEAPDLSAAARADDVSLAAACSSPRVAIGGLTFGAGLFGCVVRADPEEEFTCSGRSVPGLNKRMETRRGMDVYSR
jgi:hypothetical protein